MLANWFIWKRNQFLTSLWQEVVLQIRANHLLKLGSYPPMGTGSSEHSFPWCLHFRKMVSRKISLGHKTDERCLSERWKSTHKFSKVNALKKRKEGKFLFSTGRTKTLIFNLYLCLQNCPAFSAEKLHLREQMEGITTSYSQWWLLGGRKSG